jgi:hypothetical protein
MRGLHSIRWAPGAVLLAVAAALAAGPTAEAEQAVIGPDPQALVRRAAEKELNEARAGHYMYLLRRQTPSGSQTRQLIETRDGLVARTVAINDKPLTPEERRADDLRLHKLLSDPQEQQRRKQEQQANEERVRKIVAALPDAFHYTFEGTESSPYGKVLRLGFRPNPEFRPPSRETQILRGMEGHAWIHAEEERLIRLDGNLVEKVNFGWGILGHLDQGGRFSIEQTRLPSGRWGTTRMRLDFTGRAVIFKKLHIQQVQTAEDFQPVPANLTLAQGVELLRKADGARAEGAPARLPTD